MNYDAELHNVTSAPVIGERLWGVIFADSKGRFRDGDSIYISTIYAIQGDIITTANTTYKMVNS
jgi:hypothetical protein|tara:strand:+ start:350 stop:541 length:192 start_codon:yes stop_codon:yes gene_type:complete